MWKFFCLTEIHPEASREIFGKCWGGGLRVFLIFWEPLLPFLVVVLAPSNWGIVSNLDETYVSNEWNSTHQLFASVLSHQVFLFLCEPRLNWKKFHLKHLFYLQLLSCKNVCLNYSCTLDIQIPPEVRFLSFFYWGSKCCPRRCFDI